MDRVFIRQKSIITHICFEHRFDYIASQGDYLIMLSRLVVVSNRLPVAISGDKISGYEVKPGTGGLVTALEPIIRQTNGTWIGWPGCSSDVPFESLLSEYSRNTDFELIPIQITEEDIDKYYRGFSNKSIWPLFHDLLGQFSFKSVEYDTYREVNKKFAEVIAKNIETDDAVWIHDFQLICAGHYLKELGVSTRLNFFLHIPFPSFDLLRRLPRKTAMMKSLLKYDHIGFQTLVDKRNFISCLKWLVPEAKAITKRRQSTIHYANREISVGHYPISIDFKEFNDQAKTVEVSEAAWYLKENIKADVLVLGLDRLDYTKGIPERFMAFEKLLEKYPDVCGKISLLQIVVPSRLNVAEYQELKSELESLAGRINGRFSTSGWIPIHYQFRTLDRIQLIGHYKAADIALITPLRDGMNLVSKEYCASSIDSRGILILSEFAGAAVQLRKGAIVVNPFDVDLTADAIYAAYNMTDEEKTRRMRVLRAEVKRNDVHRWVRQFLGEE
jgi:trehalose 6-phosphate synthase/phosphatase